MYVPICSFLLLQLQLHLGAAIIALVIVTTLVVILLLLLAVAELDSLSSRVELSSLKLTSNFIERANECFRRAHPNLGTP